MTDYLELLLELLEEPEEKEETLAAGMSQTLRAGAVKHRDEGRLSRPTERSEQPEQPEQPDWLGRPVEATALVGRSEPETDGSVRVWDAETPEVEMRTQKREKRAAPEEHGAEVLSLPDAGKTAGTGGQPGGAAWEAYETGGLGGPPVGTIYAADGQGDTAVRRRYRSGRPGDVPARTVEEAREALGRSGTTVPLWDGAQRSAEYWNGTAVQRGEHTASSGGSAAMLERRLARSAAWTAVPPKADRGAAEQSALDMGLELEELDQRVRRDARRYDGVLTPY